MRRRRPLRIAGVAVAVVVVLALVATERSSAKPDVSGANPNRSRTQPAAAAAPAAARPAQGPEAVDRDRFVSGACERYLPTSGDRHITVFLDAGHGGLDPGAVGTTASGQQVEEAVLTLPVELDAMSDLRRAGFTVVVSRTADTSVARLTAADVSGRYLTSAGVHDDVAARAVCANEAHASLLVGIYFDAASSPSSAGALTGYDQVRPFAAANLRFAELLQGALVSAMNHQGWGIPDDGVLTDDLLGSAVNEAAVEYGHLLLLGPAERGYFTSPSLMPGALTEPLFVTDPFEASIAASPRGQEVMAAGIAAAVGEYFARAP